MKKLVLLVFITSFIFSCEKEPIQHFEHGNDPEVEISANMNDRLIVVCHKGKEISINENAISAHIAHGDAIDMDGDGYFDAENECNDLVDCDDLDPMIHPGAEETLCNGTDDDCNPATPDTQEEICDNGIDDDCDGDIDEADSDCSSCEDGIKVDWYGTPYYVIFTETQGTYSHADAVRACEDLVTENGCDDWTLLDRALVPAYNYHHNVASIPGVQPGYYWISPSLYSWMYIHNMDHPGNIGTSVRPAGRKYNCACERKG